MGGGCRLITINRPKVFRVDLNNVDNAHCQIFRGLVCLCRPTDVDQVSTLTTRTPMHTVSLPSHYPPYIRIPQQKMKRKKKKRYHTIVENVY